MCGQAQEIALLFADQLARAAVAWERKGTRIGLICVVGRYVFC